MDVGSSDACYIACVLLEHAIICVRPSTAANTAAKEAEFLHAASSIVAGLVPGIGSPSGGDDAAASVFYAAIGATASLTRVPAKEFIENAAEAFRAAECRRMLTAITGVALLFCDHYEPTAEAFVTTTGAHYLHSRVAAELRQIAAMLDEQGRKWEFGARATYFDRPVEVKRRVFAIDAERLVPQWMGRDRFVERMYTLIARRRPSTHASAAAAAAASPSSSSGGERKRQRAHEEAVHAAAPPSPLELQLSPSSLLLSGGEEDVASGAVDNADRYEQEARTLSDVEILRGLNAAGSTVFSSAQIPASHAVLAELDYAKWDGYRREYRRRHPTINIVGEWSLAAETKRMNAAE